MDQALCQNNLPETFLARLSRLVPPEKFSDVLESFAHKPLPSFRTNTLKIATEELKKRLENQEFIIKSVPWYQDAFVLRNKSIRELTETEEYKEGLLYIQNLSSMIPSLILDPKPNETILDLCAAPGSKTTHTATLMENQGEIVANDISRQRLYKLRANLATYGVTNTIVTNIPGQAIWRRYPEYFDKTLVDAPCTMEGRIDCNDPKTYKDWSLRKIKDLATRQKYLLRSAISATKVGGIVIYSTCTLAPEENEGVIDWILKKEGDAISIEPIKKDTLPLNEGIVHWEKDYQEQIRNTARIFPSPTMEGFFIAKIRKHKATLHFKDFSHK